MSKEFASKEFHNCDKTFKNLEEVALSNLNALEIISKKMGELKKIKPLNPIQQKEEPKKKF